MASLPDVVQRSGVKVSKSTRNYLIIVGLISEDGSMSGEDLRDYAQSESGKNPVPVRGRRSTLDRAIGDKWLVTSAGLAARRSHSDRRGTDNVAARHDGEGLPFDKSAQADRKPSAGPDAQSQKRSNGGV